MNQTVFAIAAAIVGGVLLALQPPTNAMLARGVGSTVNAAMISFVVGAVALGVAAAVLGARPEAGAMKALPAWAWIGGVYGAVFVFAIAFGAPRIGVAATLTLAIAAQLATAVAVDHFGWLGLARRPVDLVKAAGVAMVFVGALLVRKG
jgi:transporter family-2 protein